MSGRAGLRAAVVGAGLMGRWHAHAIVRCGYQLSAIVDVDQERANSLSARFSGCAAHRSLSALNQPVDVVHICTPAPAHAAQIESALALNCHVLAEKPLAKNAAETRALLDLAGRHQRLLVPVHQYPFQRGVRDAVRWLDAIGPVLHVDMTTCTAGADGQTDAQRDELTISVLPHAFSVIASLLGDGALDVEWAVDRARAGELRVATVFGGASVSAMVSTHGRPTTNTVRVTGARGTVHVDLFHGFAFRTSGNPSREDKIARPFRDARSMLVHASANLIGRTVRREPAYPGLRELVRGFYEAARSGTTGPVPPSQTIAIAVAVDRVAARAGMT